MNLSQTMTVLSAFQRHEVEYVLVGSMAMAAQGLIRATRDMDVFVSPEEANVERLKKALQEVFDDPAIEEISSAELSGDYPAIQYVPPNGEFGIDILARLGEAFGYADIEYEVMEAKGVKIRVATPEMLYRMKKDTVWPQDRLDAETLRQRFDIEED